MFATKFVECLQVAGTWVTREERPILPLQQGEQFSGEEASALQWIAPGAEIQLFSGLCVALSRPALATATRGIYFGDPTPSPTLPLAPALLAASLGLLYAVSARGLGLSLLHGLPPLQAPPSSPPRQAPHRKRKRSPGTHLARLPACRPRPLPSTQPTQAGQPSQHRPPVLL